MGDISKDERFSSVFQDPRFRKVPFKERKTKVDKRFEAMFKDKNFKLNYVMDKRGRPMEHTSSEDLKRFYNLSSSESEDKEDEDDHSSNETSSLSENDNEYENEEEKDKSKLKSKKNLAGKKNMKDFEMDDVDNDKSEDNESEGDENEDDEIEDDEESLKLDGKGDAKFIEEESDSDSTSEDEGSLLSDELNNEVDHKWEELDANAPVATETTKRLAVCNMDWDRIRAEDILSVFNSFKPADGIIHSVKIYPSEYGLERMEEERLCGPHELVEKTLEEGDEKKDPAKEGSRYHREKLRQYQINRLKYCYAVVECDSPETADSLYVQLNGMEYESSAVCLDIRFIPDDVVFEQEPKSCALTAPDPTEYKPRLFINSALQQVKVNLTWDETDPKRRETLQKAFHEPESIEKDIKNYLASSSSSDEEVVSCSENVPESNRKLKMKERIANYRSLLQSLEEKEKEDESEYELEIKWEPGLKEKTEEIVKEKLQKDNMNPFEEKLKKIKDDKKLKKKERKKHIQEGKKSSDHESSEFSDQEDSDSNDDFDLKYKTKSSNREAEQKSKMEEELSLLMADPDKEPVNENKRKERKKKQKNKNKESKEDDFKLNIDDSRFSAVYSSHLYNIDPSDPHYKDTKGMQTFIQEKQKKKRNHFSDSVTADQPSLKQTKLSHEAMKLVDSVKRKTKLNTKNK